MEVPRVKEMVSRCGYRCDLCLALRPNVERLDQRAYLRDNWMTYFGLDLPVERLMCDGCLSADPDAQRVDASCPVRPCTIERALEHCGQCEDFPCPKLEQRRGHNLEQAKEAAGEAFAMPDFRKCVLPYDNFTRLGELRRDGRRLERLTNAAITPSLEQMARFIGGEDAERFLRLAHLLQALGDLAIQINYGGANYGWELNVRKASRPMVSVTPVRGAFLVLCVLGKKELEVLAASDDLLSAGGRQSVDGTPALHDGKWVQLRVSEETGLRDALALFAVKRFGVKARDRLVSLNC
jgi:hypothetical protein